MPDSLRRYLDFGGRLSRLGYWRRSLTLSAAFAVIWIVGLMTVLGVGRLGAVLFIALAPLAVMMVAAIVQRLHDRGRSGWWILAFNVGPLLAAGWLEGMAETAPWGLVLMLSLASIALSIWGFVELGLLRGAAGANRFGDDPSAQGA